MKNVNRYQALIPDDKAIKIIKKWLEKEKKGDKEARKKAELDLKRHLIQTGDGSFTLNSSALYGKPETMHTDQGAITESLEKFVKPARLEGKREVKILDVCSGLGYNAASSIEYLDGKKIEVDMVEISAETLAAALLIENPIGSYEVIKSVIEEKLYNEGYLGYKSHYKRRKGLSISIYVDDVRAVVKDLDKGYDAVFLDPFSPLKSPELYTLQFFQKLNDLLKNDGIILTYTSAAPVRSAMVKAGLHVGEGPQFGRKSGGTVATKDPSMIERSLSPGHERIIALSDAGIPFKDPRLNETPQKIMDRREIERKSARGVTKFASTVKTPLFLYRDMEESRLKRRVLKNMGKLGIYSLRSNKAAYIVCPQFEQCICSCGGGKIENSKDRMDEMEKRLEIILER